MVLVIIYADKSPIVIDTNNVKKMVSDGEVDIIVIDESSMPTAIKERLLQEALREANISEDISDDMVTVIFSVNIDSDGATLAAFIPATPSSFDGCSEIPLSSKP